MTTQAEHRTNSRSAPAPSAGPPAVAAMPLAGPGDVVAELRAELLQRERERDALARADAALYGSLRLEDIFEALFDVAADVLEAPKAAVWTWDEARGGWVTSAARGSDVVRWSQVLPPDEWIVRATFEENGLAVVDRRTDPRLPPPIREALERDGIMAFLNAPIHVGEETFGVFAVSYGEPRSFGTGERRLLDDLARRAGLAIKNARLNAREAQHLREIEALYRADEALLGSLRLDDVLQTVVDVASELLGADKTSLLVWDEQHESLVPGAVRGFSPESVASMRHLVGEGITGLVAALGRPIVVEEATTDPRVAHHITDPEGIRSLLHVPIEISGEVFGVFGVNYCRPRRFTGEEERLLLAFAQRAALAIENARLYEQAQQAAVLEERQRIARELHDAVTQTLFSASLLAEVTPRLWERNPDEGRRRLEELRQLTRGALAEMRTLLLELRPAALTEVGLEVLLRQLGEAVTSRSQVQVDVSAEGEARELSADGQVMLYRLAQESLNNVAKHARASHAAVRIAWHPDAVRVAIQDDGCGFDPASVPPGHLGLGIMRERAAAMGATVSVKSEPGRGTWVEIEWRDRQAGT